MLPLVLDPSSVRIGVAGKAGGLKRRLDLLEKAGVRPAAVFEDRLPAREEIATLNVLFVAGLDAPQSQALAEAARSARALVNVEDVPALCDFHVPAQVRRGDLVVAVSTAGRSPALAKVLREDLERRFGPEWTARAQEAAELRQKLRSEGLSPEEVSERTRALIAEKGWLA